VRSRQHGSSTGGKKANTTARERAKKNEERAETKAGIDLNAESNTGRQTKIFLICTNTLGADTTAILVSGPASLNSSFARVVAVSSEYCFSG